MTDARLLLLPSLLLLVSRLVAMDVPNGVVAIVRDGETHEEPGGNAVIIAADGTALSLSEAIPAAAERIQVVIPGGFRRSAQVIRRDAASSAVLLRIEGLPPGIRPFPIADSGRVQVLDPVWTAGNAAGAIALDGAAALSCGVASGIYDIPSGTPPVRGRGGHELSAYRGAAIETDAAINDGNEGGALLDAGGQLIGLASRGQTRERRLPVAVPVARILAALGLPAATLPPAGGGEAWRRSVATAATSLALIYLERLHGPGNPPGVPRPPRAVADVPEVDRERLQNWWDVHYHQQQIFYTDQPVCALAIDADLLLTAASNLHGEAVRGRLLITGGAIPCQVVATNQALDLALLRCERPHGLTPARLATATPLLGERVVLLGRHRLDAGWTATLGTISATTRRRAQSRLGLLQTDARANYGSLGGPLITADGAVSGLCVMLGPMPDRPWLINSGVAMAVDATRIRDALPALREGRSTARQPILGLGIVMRQRGAELIVEQVTPGTGAEAAGMRVRDILLRVDGQRATSSEAISRVLMRHQPGDRVAVEVRRGQETPTLQVEIREFSP